MSFPVNLRVLESCNGLEDILEHTFFRNIVNLFVFIITYHKTTINNL